MPGMQQINFRTSEEFLKLTRIRSEVYINLSIYFGSIDLLCHVSLEKIIWDVDSDGRFVFTIIELLSIYLVHESPLKPESSVFVEFSDSASFGNWDSHSLVVMGEFLPDGLIRLFVLGTVYLVFIYVVRTTHYITCLLT